MFASIFRHSLARELAIVLAVKFVLIALAAIFLFGPATRLHPGAAAIVRHLFNPPPQG